MPRQTQAMKTPAEIIRAEAARRGVLPFRALHGTRALLSHSSDITKSKRTAVGRRGDFYTSVSTGELFGQLLAFQFAGWLEDCGIVNSEVANCRGRRARRETGRRTF
jgi:SAM-dependent MidA family methyltransferase